jgi:hypothetical protein
MRGAVPFGDALLSAHRDTGALNFTNSGIQALESETGCDSVVPASLALDSPAFDLHCFRGYSHNFFSSALRCFVHVIFFKAG